MSEALADLMEKNLLEVFGQVNSARRAAAIAEVYTADCTVFETEGQITGREALNAKVESILKDAPGFLFRSAEPAQVIHDLGRCGGSLDRPEPRRLSRVRTLLSLSTEESEPCARFLMKPRAPEVAPAAVWAPATRAQPSARDDSFGCAPWKGGAFQWV